MFALALAVSAAASNFPETVELVRWDQVWRYEPSGTNLAAHPWTTPAYDDSHWYSGPGMFAFPLDEPLFSGRTNNTMIFINPGGVPILTFYFRARFEWTHAWTPVLTFSNLIDDGAIFYLNDVELKRIAMPTGAVDNVTTATRQGDVVGYGYDVFTVENPPINPGFNTLAVELHNVAITSGDMVLAVI